MIARVLLLSAVLLSCVSFVVSLTKLDDSSVKEAVDLYVFHVSNCKDHFSNCSDSESLARLKHDGYDQIQDWDVSAVTNMSRLFSRASLFNGDVSTW